jgi:hypothetical protein
LAQKSLPILNRTGIYQHWENTWDSKLHYNTNLKSTFLIEKILSNFLEHRNSLNPTLMTKNFIDKYKRKLGLKIRKINFFLIAKTIKKIRRRKNLYIYVGKTTFVKIQSWLVIILFIFKPVKIKKKLTKKKKVKRKVRKVNRYYINYFLTDQLRNSTSTLGLNSF